MRTSALALGLLLASCRPAEKAPAISVEDAWARASVGPQASSAAYFTIRNKGGADALLAVTSPAADASLHSTTMDNGVMRMRPLDRLDIPANATVQLKPGGTHVMLMGLRVPISAGSTIPLDLKFEHSGDRHVTAAVKPPSANGVAM